MMDSKRDGQTYYHPRQSRDLSQKYGKGVGNSFPFSKLVHDGKSRDTLHFDELLGIRALDVQCAMLVLMQGSISSPVVWSGTSG